MKVYPMKLFLVTAVLSLLCHGCNTPTSGSTATSRSSAPNFAAERDAQALTGKLAEI